MTAFKPNANYKMILRHLKELHLAGAYAPTSKEMAEALGLTVDAINYGLERLKLQCLIKTAGLPRVILIASPLGWLRLEPPKVKAKPVRWASVSPMSFTGYFPRERGVTGDAIHYLQCDGDDIRQHKAGMWKLNGHPKPVTAGHLIGRAARIRERRAA